MKLWWRGLHPLMRTFAWTFLLTWPVFYGLVFMQALVLFALDVSATTAGERYQPVFFLTAVLAAGVGWAVGSKLESRTDGKERSDP